MTGVLARKVLVLNKSWLPVDVVSVMAALCRVFSEKALFVDSEYQTYDWEAWVETWEDAVRHAKVETERVIHAPQVNVVAPEVILHVNHKRKSIKSRPRFSRKNVYIRDGYRCQYCDKRFPSSELNIDHVVPTSRGGKTTWTNTVLSCVACNDKKANRTPEEAGMTLIRQPQVPSAEDVRRGYLRRVMSHIRTRPSSWEAFVRDLMSDMYWNVTLRD